MKKKQQILWILLLLFPLIFSVSRYAYGELRPVVPPSDKEGITFMTYNIHFGRGEDDLLNLERLAQNILIGDPDIVGLQEVENGRITSQGIDMVRWLAHRLNMYFCFFPVDNELMTNPILSKYPIIAAEGYPIPSLLHKRQFTRAVIEIDETLQIDVYNVHSTCHRNARTICQIPLLKGCSRKTGSTMINSIDKMTTQGVDTYCSIPFR